MRFELEQQDVQGVTRVRMAVDAETGDLDLFCLKDEEWHLFAWVNAETGNINTVESSALRDYGFSGEVNP